MKGSWLHGLSADMKMPSCPSAITCVFMLNGNFSKVLSKAIGNVYIVRNFVSMQGQSAKVVIQ